jgi:predicted transcriptional regulator
MRTVVGIRSGTSARSRGPAENFSPTIWFDSWRQLAGVLSDENRTLLRLIRDR